MSTDREIARLTEELPQLTTREIQFLLAYCGVDLETGKCSAPRSARDAYLVISPKVQRLTAENLGQQMMRKIRRKGGASLIAEYRGLSILRACDAVEECLHAETVKIVRYPGGVWDYVYAPDYRTRLRAGRILYEIHGAIGPEAQVNVNIDNRMTFAEAIAQQAEVGRAEVQAIESPDERDAEYRDVK